ncbi:class F sortase [Clavibacter sp. VKM Ac-2873]|uniref:class F sortase n=1 Tax=Clavibacter sp. VKM Ac-2873 TaxID=2783813 RepID=UPI00188D160E|nr:class F sortase [Clavibacter sp. VKM Ac-2873]MBF4619244.1 class F sortase [Clavibacter sp. VKM Ac-2873]
MTTPATSDGRTTRRRLLTAAGVVVASAAVVAGALAAVGGWPVSAGLPRDLAGAPVQADVPAPAAGADGAGTAVDSGLGRFRAPSVGLDVPLGAVDVVGGVVDPPGFSSAYRVRDLGVAPEDAAHGTVFVVMHSVRGGGTGPGDRLIDDAAGSASVAPGTVIQVAGVDYAVGSSRAVPKGQLPDDAEVWADTPGRLVVITCLQRPDGSPSRDDMVIEATRA